MGIRQILIGKCPLCGEPIDSAVMIDTADRSSPFWGEPGKRFLICKEGAHSHIEVETPGGVSNRYAYVIPYSLPKRNKGS